MSNALPAVCPATSVPPRSVVTLHDGGKLILALPNGRILTEAMLLLRRAGIVPEQAFHDEGSRTLRFRSNEPMADLIRVRSFDVATFVAFGAAQLGIAGSDVIMEFGYPEVCSLLDLGIGRCRLSVAEPDDAAQREESRDTPLRVATKYPGIARRHFEARGIPAECVKLNGAVELAPQLGLSRCVVDLVDTGATLKANNLVEVDYIADVTSHLVVNRRALTECPNEIFLLVDRIRKAIPATQPHEGSRSVSHGSNGGGRRPTVVEAFGTITHLS